MQIQSSQIKQRTLTILIDGVFFQLADSGIARVWRSLLHEWVKNGFAKHLILLDRDSTAPQIAGINYQLIHRYEENNSAEDSFLLQEMCDQHQADLFISTYYTTPISTPGILLVHDMIPEAIGADLTAVMWQEKSYAICYAARYIAISESTARDLHYFYPQIAPATITVALCGIAPLFMPSNQGAIEDFCTTNKITQPYFVIVGTRVGLNGYKNGIHTFRALSQLPDHGQFEIICVGGNPNLETEIADLIKGIKVHQLSLNDQELQAAYSGAIALLYPSCYEGFGLPILEAMACGCPVITCHNSSLPEVAGDAAIYVSETDLEDLVTALYRVQQPEVRSPLIAAGLIRAKYFSWAKMADTIAQVLLDTHADIQSHKLQLTPKLSWAQFRQVLLQNQQKSFGLKAQLATSQAELVTSQTQLATLQVELVTSQAQLITATIQISSMENTKFWQLRQQWFRLKEILGLS